MISSVPVRVHAARTPAQKPGSGSTMPMFVSAGSASTHAISPLRERRFERGQVVELDHRGRLRRVDRRRRPARAARAGGRPRAPRTSRRPSRGSTRRTRARLRRPRELAAEAQREAVGVGGGERELPLRQTEAPGELGADPGRVLARQHHGDAAAHAPAVRAPRRPSARASAPPSRPCHRGRGRRTRGRRGRRRSRRAPRRGRPGSRRPTSPSTASARRRAGAGRAASYAARERGCAAAKRSRSDAEQHGEPRSVPHFSAAGQAIR